MVFTSTNLALIAAVISAAAYLPYAYAVIRGVTKPQRSSWLIWSVLSSIAFFAVIASGGTQGLFFTGAQATGTILIFTLSLWRGTGALTNRKDAMVLILSLLGLILWAVTENPNYAMALSIILGALGGSLTLIKSFTDPRSEALTPWVLQTLAAGFGSASVLGATALEMAYPLYLLALYGSILISINLGYMAQNRRAIAV